jgi:hypothetical protein
MFAGLVEAPVCVYCDTLLHLDDRFVVTGADEDKEETEETQSIGPDDGSSSVAQNGEKDVPLDTVKQSTLSRGGFHESEN